MKDLIRTNEQRINAAHAKVDEDFQNRDKNNEAYVDMSC